MFLVQVLSFWRLGLGIRTIIATILFALALNASNAPGLVAFNG